MDLNKSKNISNHSVNHGVANCVINLQIPFLTATQLSLLINGVLEHCLLFAGQIPIAFPAFKESVKKVVVGQENRSDNVSWSSHLQTKSVQAAKQLIDDVLVIKDNVIQEFKKTEITEAVIALGSSIFTVRQAIVIRLPSVDKNHSCANHERANVGLVLNLMRSLGTSDVMSKVSDFNGKSIKVFLLLRKSGHANQNDFFTPMPGFQLPSKCKTTCLELILDETNQTDGNCCKLMKICTDVSNISIYDEEDQMDDLAERSYNWFISSIPIKGLKQLDLCF